MTAKAVRPVVTLLVASLSLSVVFALLTLVFQHNVLAYQLARHPGSDPGALAATLWTRPIPVVVVAVLYIWVIRQLRAGVPRAYRRVRIVSVAGFVVVAALLVTAEYPSWLRVVQGLQLVVLAALIVAVNRPAVRAAFPAVPDPRPRNRRAALFLVVLTPLVAEAGLGNIPLRQAWLLLLFIPIYGAGALLIREVVRRTGGGVPALLLMGVTYGLVEEGLALQSLTSPHLYGAAAWSPRLFGLNTAYTELNLAYHAVFSVTIPILLTELLFPTHGPRPYLRRAGLITTAIVAALGAALIRVSIPPTEDPGYTMPLLATLLIAASATATTVAALKLRPTPNPHPAPPSHPTAAHPTAVHPAAVHPAAVLVRRAAPPGALAIATVTAAAAFAFLALIWPFAGATQPFFTHGAWSLLPMAIAALIAAATLHRLHRWTLTPRLTWSACIGALVAHTAFGLLANAETLPDRLLLAAATVLTAAAGVVASRRIPAAA